MNDSKLPAVISCRDLGVIVSQNLKPAEHIGLMVAKVTVYDIYAACFQTNKERKKKRTFCVLMIYDTCILFN